MAHRLFIGLLFKNTSQLSNHTTPWSTPALPHGNFLFAHPSTWTASVILSDSCKWKRLGKLFSHCKGMFWPTCRITKATAKTSMAPYLSNTDKTKKEEQYTHTQGYRDSQLFHHFGIYILYGGCKCFCKGRISVSFEEHNLERYCSFGKQSVT